MRQSAAQFAMFSTLVCILLTALYGCRGTSQEASKASRSMSPELSPTPMSGTSPQSVVLNHPPPIVREASIEALSRFGFRVVTSNVDYIKAERPVTADEVQRSTTIIGAIHYAPIGPGGSYVFHSGQHIRQIWLQSSAPNTTTLYIVDTGEILSEIRQRLNER